MGWIYIIINLVNWKIYIGKWGKSNINTRFNYYKKAKSHNRHLNASIRKYGVEHFYFGVLHKNMPKEYLGYLERTEIARYNCNSCRGGWGYNQTDGGDGIVGYKPSKVRKGEDHHYYGKNLSDEHRHKISESMKGEKNHFYGKSHTPISLQKQSESKKGAKNPNYNRAFSDEHRRKIADAVKNRPAEVTQRIIESHKRPEYYKAKKMFCSLPKHMSIKDKRKLLYLEYPSVPKVTVCRWIRTWDPESFSEPRKSAEYNKAYTFFCSLPSDMPFSQKKKLLLEKFNKDVHRSTTDRWIKQFTERKS